MKVLVMNKMIYRVLCVFLIFSFLHTPSYAQKGKPETDEQRTARCPEGQYAGPYEGARRFYQDPYVWFVSPEFARRFCMPESYIDESLKGALALAVRLKPEEFTLCGFVGGPGSCPPKQKLLIDVYIDNQKVKLPKADPTVKYYSGDVANSGEVIGIGRARSDRRRKGEITEVEGERRPFSPISSSLADNQKVKTYFIFMGARDKWATGSGDFIEHFYKQDWVPGIDLITLDGYLFGYQSLRNPDEQLQTVGVRGRTGVNGNLGYVDYEHDQANPIRHWAIGVINGPDYFKKHRLFTRDVSYPEGFDHVIVLPHKVAQIIYQFDWKQGEVFFNNAKSALQNVIDPKNK